MRLTFPHMGNLWMSVKTMLDSLGVAVVLPPPSTKRTLSLGVRYAPEGACLPLKLNVGNFIEAAERGADTVIMAGGCGPCRFGYYAQVEEAVLGDLGVNLRFLVLEPPEKHARELLDKIRTITGTRSWWRVLRAVRRGFLVACGLDALERKAQYVRPRELSPGDADRILAAVEREAASVPAAEIPGVVRRALAAMEQVPRRDDRPVLRVGVVGEIFTVLEPFVNLDLMRRLGALGVEAERSIYLSEWINEHLFLGFHPGIRSSRPLVRAARPYLGHGVGGHGQETVGSGVLYGNRGLDGIVQLLPFTCMPEIVAQHVLPSVSRDLRLPVLTLVLDEQTGETGVTTRLEAFVDLLWSRRGGICA